MPKGVPSSSFREYRFPILADDESILLEMPIFRNLVVSFLKNGSKLCELDNGTSRTFVGATVGGKDNTYKV